MRRFLVVTAAFRVLIEDGKEKNGMTEPIRDLLYKGGELAVDFAEALVLLHGDDLLDVRKGLDCEFHEHEVTTKCKPSSLEAYQG